MDISFDTKRMGHSQVRDEDGALVRGLGRYASDVSADDALWMHVLRSPYAAGRITMLDVSEAAAMPGVHAILTAQDQTGCQPFPLRTVPAGTSPRPTPYYPLATDSVHWAGEPVAAIIADTPQAAQDAADAIMLDVADAPVVTEATPALDAPPVWADHEGNVAFTHERGDRSAFLAAVDQAAHVVTADIEVSRVTAVTLETRCGMGVAEPDGTYTLYTGTQAAHRIRSEIAHVLGVPQQDVRVRAEQTGGSFGMRNGAFPEDILILLAARKTGRPVRWAATRSDAFVSDTSARPQSVTATLALDADGRFLALGVDGAAPLGAQLGPSAAHSMTTNLPGLAGVYRTPIIHVTMRGVHVNTIHMAPYRGAGRPEAIYVIERMVEIAASELGLDPVDLRLRNMIQPADMPYDTPLGFPYDSGDFPGALHAALKAADHDGFEARRAEAAARGRLRGLGIACAIEPAGGGPKGSQAPEFAAITAGPEGLELRLGSGDAGQGHATTFRQVAQDLLGWDGDVTIVASDTGLVDKGTGTFGSRTLGAVGAALTVSTNDLVASALPDAAAALEVAQADLVFEHGTFRVVGTDRTLTLEGLIAQYGKTYAADAFVKTDAGTFPNAAHVVEVEIDPETGALELCAYTVADDVGRIINPLLVEGQMHGGIAQGLGQAFLERMVYDPSTGALLSGSLMDYAVPRADTLCPVKILHVPTPTKANPLGTKGAGESGTVGSLSAGMNAVYNAIGPRAARHLDMPATPHRIWEALQAAQATDKP